MLAATNDLFRTHRGAPLDQPPQIGPFVVRPGQSGQKGGRIDGVTRLPALNDGDAPHQATVENDNLTFANPYARVTLTYLMSISSYLIFRPSVRGAA